MHRASKFIFVIGILLCAACKDGKLRGSVQDSKDGKTYLLIAQGNNCDQINIDGTVWPHPIGTAGEISPGEHSINCNGEIGFKIPKGVVFKFDYWGP